MLLATSRVTLTATNATTTVETGALGVVIPEDPEETRRDPKIPEDPEDTRRKPKKTEETRRKPKKTEENRRRSSVGHS
jgi:hypothetical protein